MRGGPGNSLRLQQLSGREEGKRCREAVRRSSGRKGEGGGQGGGRCGPEGRQGRWREPQGCRRKSQAGNRRRHRQSQIAPGATISLARLRRTLGRAERRGRAVYIRSAAPG